MSLTFERIEALAPDQASLAAAQKLLKAFSWPTLAVGEGLDWGECQGSGATSFRVVINEADTGYKCTCQKIPEKDLAFNQAAVAIDLMKTWRAMESLVTTGLFVTSGPRT